MPELPDLIVFAENLRKLVLDKPITSATLYNRKKVNLTPAQAEQTLVGQRIASIDRDGKELFFTISSRKAFAVHLMLNGQFTYMPYLDTHSVNAKIMTLGFEDGNALVISDRLGMCRVTFAPRHTGVPDAFGEAFTYVYFQRMIKLKPRVNIKAFLIDQQNVRGIGNAYADEILYAANISPKSTAGKIPEAALHALYDAIGAVLHHATHEIRRLKPDSISGEERSFLQVHLHKKKETPNGEPILCEEIAGKRTYYVAEQALYQ